LFQRFWDHLQQAVEDRWDGFAEALVRFGVGLLAAVIILWVSVKLARLAQWLLLRRLPMRKDRQDFQPLVGRAAFVLVVAIGVFIALTALGVDQTALATFSGVGIVAASLALQDVLKNFVAGIYLLFEHPFAVGDRIRISGEEGIVLEIGMRTTILRNDEGQEVQVPNYNFLTAPMTDLTETDAVGAGSEDQI
jgi:small-conductance mechanosensitive channel